MMIRHRVADYGTWRRQFDANQPMRLDAGVTDLYLWRGADDGNEVVLMFAVADIEDARRFADSADLKNAMQRAGVIGDPEVLFLDGEELLMRRESFSTAEAPA